MFFFVIFSERPRYCQILFLIAYLEGNLNRNIVIFYVLIITCNHNNYNSIINNYNCGRLLDLILVVKIPMGTRKSYIEFYRKLGTRPQKVSPTLMFIIQFLVALKLYVRVTVHL